MIYLNQNQKLVQHFDAGEFGTYKNIRLQRKDFRVLCSCPPQYSFYDENKNIQNIRHDEVLEISEVQSFNG